MSETSWTIELNEGNISFLCKISKLIIKTYYKTYKLFCINITLLITRLYVTKKIVLSHDNIPFKITVMIYYRITIIRTVFVHVDSYSSIKKRRDVG